MVQDNLFFEERDNGLNSRYSFENLVVGNSNRVGNALGLAICENLGRIYNPLLIVGDFGLGKTHLLNAIGQRALQINPSLKVLYVTGEQFCNELINAIRDNEVLAFRNYYRSRDLLLIDNVDFVGGKEATSEEFLHTFDSLLHNNKQLVMTSERLPANIPYITERLRSRLQSGVMTIVQPPDYDMRFTFLQEKTKDQAVSFPADVLRVIAEKVTVSFGNLEGTIKSLAAYFYYNDAPVTLETVEGLLEEMKIGIKS